MSFGTRSFWLRIFFFLTVFGFLMNLCYNFRTAQLKKLALFKTIEISFISFTVFEIQMIQHAFFSVRLTVY